MNRYRLYPCIVLLIIVCSSNDTKNDSTHQSSPIKISKCIQKKYPSVYHLLSDSIIGGHLPYKLEVYNSLTLSGDQELYFVAKRISPDYGGRTKPLYPNKTQRWRSKNTIILNSFFLQKGSKEYIAQTMIHESIHAFILWCSFSYRNGHKNGVDSTFLQKYFPLNWKLFNEHPDSLYNENQHILMSENYPIEAMRKCIYEYTNTNIRTSLRDTIARSMAWAGLNATPAWKQQTDICLMKCIDILSRDLKDIPNQKNLDTCCQKIPRELLQEIKLAFQSIK